jgi:hypothetical protein
VRLVWFEGPVGRAHSLLRDEAKSGKDIVAVSSASEYDSKVTFRDVFNTKRSVIVVMDEMTGIDSIISNACSSWADDDMVIFINRKRTAWTKCCSLAKQKQTLVEIPSKMNRQKAAVMVSKSMKMSADDSWAAEMVLDSCSASAWSKEVDVEKLDMTLAMLNLTFSRRKPRDKSELGCALGFYASDILAKVSEAHNSGDAVSYCRLHDIAMDMLGSSIHAMQAVSSSSAVKNAKLHVLKACGASASDISDFKKNDGTPLWNQYMLNRFESNTRMSSAFAGFIGSCEAAGSVPYGSWGSLAWASVLLHKSGGITAAEMAKIISAYKSVKKGGNHGSDAR